MGPSSDPAAYLFGPFDRLHSDYFALIEKRNMAVLAEVKQGRVMAEQLHARHPD